VLLKEYLTEICRETFNKNLFPNTSEIVQLQHIYSFWHFLDALIFDDTEFETMSPAFTKSLTKQMEDELKRFVINTQLPVIFSML